MNQAGGCVMYVYRETLNYEKQGAQLLEPEVRTHTPLHSQKPQNPLVCEGEVTPADARGHWEGGLIRAGMEARQLKCRS